MCSVAKKAKDHTTTPLHLPPSLFSLSLSFFSSLPPAFKGCAPKKHIPSDRDLAKNK